MQSDDIELVKKTKQNIQLIEGEFTPSEASHVICSLLDQKINFHKLQRLTMLEGDCDLETTYADNRIKELEQEKIVAKKFITRMRKEGLKVRINSTIEVSAAID